MEKSYLKILVFDKRITCLLFTLAAFTFTMVYGQERRSPKLKNRHGKIASNESTFSISYIDSIAFFQKYKDAIIIKYKRGNIIQANVNAAILPLVANDSNILFVDVVNAATTEAGTDFVNPAFNRITKTHRLYPTLRGNEHKISIKEKRFDPENIDLINRSFNTPLVPEETTQHATTMATFIAGGGNSSIEGLGVAPEALLTSSDFDNLLPDADNIFIENDIHIQNHSYGVGIENYYGNEAAAYDAQANENINLVHVFSAGNQGNAKPEDGVYAGLRSANLTGNFKQAKNVVVATAVDTTLESNTRNSKGPAYDGRLKPELAAYGQGGTSDAAALVTGIATLIQEHYQDNHQTLPTAATVKAILIATADDIGKPGIDYDFGYGSVNAFNALKLIDEDHIEEISLSSNESASITINVAEHITQLKVAVTWIDPPAIQNSMLALVNDIDTYLSDGTTTYLPWVLSAFAHPDSLAATAKRSYDHRNNTEYITIENPLPGDYNLYLTAGQLSGEQMLSIAYFMTDTEESFWDYPVTADVLEAGEMHTLFWNKSFKGYGDLYYQLGEGGWQIIEENIELSSYFHWTTPDTLISAQLKMVINDKAYVSGNFLISPQPKLNVAFNCNDNFSLAWTKIDQANEYRLFTMDKNYLVEKSTEEDTAVVLTKPGSSLYYAVAPVYHGMAGLRSQSINYEEQGVSCYINLFSAIRFQSELVTLQLNLSTSANIRELNIYKNIQEDELVLFHTDIIDRTFYQIYDSVLKPGSITYLAEVILTDGTSVRSDVSQVLIESKDRAVLFPNPAHHELQVLSEGEGLTFRIINSLGQLISTVDLELTLEVIPVAALPNGIYFFEVLRNNTIIDNGRFIKQ